MRQILNWRFVAAVVALAALAFVAREVFSGEDAIDAVVEPVTIERRIDLIEPIFSVERSEDFGVGPDGQTVGFLDVIMPGPQIVRVAPGTYGEVECDALDEINQCAIFADLLGDAIVWFSIQPQAPGATVELPPILDLEDGLAEFENGWRIPFPPVIERDCPGEDIPTFRDFLRRFGPESVSIVELETREVTMVRCGVSD